MTKYNTRKQDNVEIYKLNVEEQKAVAAHYKVTRVPTLLYLKDGKVLGQKLGISSVDQLENYEKVYFSK